MSTADGGIDTVCDPSDTIPSDYWDESSWLGQYRALLGFFDSGEYDWIEIRPEALGAIREWRAGYSDQVLRGLLLPGGKATTFSGRDLDWEVVLSSGENDGVRRALDAGLTVVAVIERDPADPWISQPDSFLQGVTYEEQQAGAAEEPNMAFRARREFFVELDGRLVGADPCAWLDDGLTELAAEHGLSLRGLAEQAMREGPDGEVAGWVKEWRRSGAGRVTSTTSDGDGVSGSSSTSVGPVLWEDRAPGERSYLDPDARVEPEDRPVEVGVVMDGSVVEWVVARDAVKGVRGRWGLCSRTEVAFGSCWGLGMVEGCVEPSDGSAEEVCRRSPNQLRVLVAPGTVTEVLLRYESFSGVGGPVDWVVGRVESPPGEGEELVLVAPAGWAGLDDGAQRAALDAAAAGDGRGGGAGGWSLVTRPVGG